MSSIRLFILSSFEALGPAHGHRIRKEAEAMRVSSWTDISVGAVYGAIARLASEGLLDEVRREADGNRPPRIIYAITDCGRATLVTLRREMLEEVWFKYDPFDLALTSAEPADPDALKDMVRRRIEAINRMIAERELVIADALKCVREIDEWALRHSSYRLDAEARYLTDLLAWIDKSARQEN